MKKLLSLVLLLTIHPLAVTAQGDGQKPEKLNADEIVSGHLASLGEKSALTSTRVMTGKGSLTSKLGAGFLLAGPGQMASTDHSFVFALVFDNPSYPYEKVGFDGKDASYGLPSGKQTPLVSYLRAQGSILHDGLFGGELSTAWPLLDLKAAKAKLETNGTAKIDGKLCYKMKYSSSRTGDLKVTLYFDAETFRHVRTEYAYTIEPRIGTSPTDTRSNAMVERYDMTEDFSDFAQAGKLVLPLTYKITVSNSSQIASTSGSSLREWSFHIDKVYFDQTLPSSSFKVS
jgi:hypothetical protein